MPFIPTAALSPGSAPQSQTVTTDPDTYESATAIFDFGGPVLVEFTVMATAFVPDGETFGDQPGDIQGAFAGNGIEMSLDGVLWLNLQLAMSTGTAYTNPIGGWSSPGHYVAYVVGTYRYLRCAVGIIDNDFDPYAGPNHPTMTVQITAKVTSAGTPGSASSGDLQATFALSAQEIKDSTLTPFEVVPAQGAGTLIVPRLTVSKIHAGAVPFSDSGIALVLGTNALSLLNNGLNSAVDFVVANSSWLQSPSLNLEPQVNEPLFIQAGFAGQIVTSSILLAGSDYAVGDTGTINDGTSLAEYIVTSVDGLGAVTGYTITDPGDGYYFDTGEAGTPGGGQPGIGTGFQILIESVDASGATGDSTITGTVYYIVADVV